MTELPENHGEQPAEPQPQPLPPAPPPTEPWAVTPPPIQGYGAAQYAAALPGMYVDQASGLMLPEGVTLASVGRRIGAYFLAIPLFIVTLGIGYVIWGLIAGGRGKTPALQVLGMRCWRPETHRVAGWGWMALREVIGRLVDGILSILTLVTSFVTFLATKERKSLHDFVAGTVVVHDPNKVLAGG